MRLGAAGLAGLFAVGAVGGLIGDMTHVESGTTVYLEDPLPYIWRSQPWFPLLVGAGTATLGWLRVRMAAIGRWPDEAGDGASGARVAAGGDGSARSTRPAELVREAVAMIAAVLALYALTALVRGEPQPAAVVACWAVATLIVARWARGPAELICAVLAAIVGVTTEAVLAAADTFEYAADVAQFAGVASWLPALYLAFGVVAARLGLLAARL